MKLHNFEKKILEFAKKDKVVTTAEIAKHFNRIKGLRVESY